MNDAFLPAILAEPDDDTPRLVYADWLDETGDADARARAELIRAQCELERLPPRAPRRKELRQQVNRLLTAHAGEWTRPLRDTGLGKSWTFRRGFVEIVQVSARKFARVADRLFEIAPTVRAARFPEASNEVEELVGCPYLARLSEVDLSNMCSCGGCPIEVELRTLFASSHTANLTVLNLTGDRLDPAGGEAIAASPHLSRLRVLDLSHNRIGTTGARALAATRQLAGLTSLRLGHNQIGPQGGRVLAKSPLVARLTTLDLAGNRLGDVGARAFAAAPEAECLATLDLRDNGIGAGVARALHARFGRRVKI